MRGIDWSDLLRTLDQQLQGHPRKHHRLRQGYLCTKDGDDTEGPVGVSHTTYAIPQRRRVQVCQVHLASRVKTLHNPQREAKTAPEVSFTATARTLQQCTKIKICNRIDSEDIEDVGRFLKLVNVIKEEGYGQLQNKYLPLLYHRACLKF